MSNNPQKPKKQTRRRFKKIDISAKKSWKDIVSTVDKKEIPLTVLEQISVQLIDGTSVIIDVKKLLSDGHDPNAVELILDEKFEDLGDYIETVDFFVDVDKVAETVEPETNRLLKNI